MRFSGLFILAAGQFDYIFRQSIYLVARQPSSIQMECMADKDSEANQCCLMMSGRLVKTLSILLLACFWTLTALHGDLRS